MLYNIRYWWFFLSQGNQWTKYLMHPKIQRPKPCLLMFVSLVTLDGFYLLLSTQLSANMAPEWSGRSMFHPLSHIYAKTPFCCIETIVNNALNFWLTEQTWHPLWTQIHDKCSCKMVNTQPSDIFNSFISCNLNLQSAKMSLWSFLVFSRTTTEFGRPECLASFVSVRPHFKSIYPSLYHFFLTEQSPNNTYQAIILFEQYFSPSESNALSTHEIQIFPLFWKFATVKLATFVEGGTKALFFNSNVKQGGIKYHWIFINGAIYMSGLGLIKWCVIYKN